MGYCIFGPFNLAEARAISMTDPNNVQIWGKSAHLQEAGYDCLELGGLSGVHSSCHHIGRSSTIEISFIPYSSTKMVLLNVINPFEGLYVFTSDVKPYFLTGYNRLVEKKADPNSDINIYFNGLKEQIRKIVESEDVDGYTMQKIQQSGILEPNDPGVFDGLRRKDLVELPENELESFLENIFPENIFGRNYLIGSALYYFGLPVKHLIESVIKEHQDIGQEAIFIDYCIKELGEEAFLFG